MSLRRTSSVARFQVKAKAQPAASACRSRASLSVSAARDASCSVMSREEAISLAGRPSGPGMGVTATSQTFGVPLAVGAATVNRTDDPSRAAATACRIAGRWASGHIFSHFSPITASHSSCSRSQTPFWLRYSRVPSNPRILMQSGLDSSTALANASLLARSAAARFSSVMSRLTLP